MTGKALISGTDVFRIREIVACRRLAINGDSLHTTYFTLL
jgi:hypothetical protein